MPFEEADKAVAALSDRSRSAKRVGNEVLVPLKFDDDGTPLTPDTFDIRLHLKKLRQTDYQFLDAWRESGWNTEKAKEKLGLNDGQVMRLVAKLEVFREEEARALQLAKIPTPAWITAKHVENVFEGGTLEDSERDSLKELAKISGAYKTAATVNIQNNFFSMPKVSEEQMVKLREFADAQANVIEGEIAA